MASQSRIISNMKSLFLFLLGFVVCGILCGSFFIVTQLGPIAVWPFSSFVSAKLPTASEEVLVNSSGTDSSQFWRQIAIFAEENGFSSNLAPFDHGPRTRLSSSLTRGDDIRIEVSLYNNLYYIRVISFAEHPSNLTDTKRKIGQTFIENNFAIEKKT